MGMRGGGAGRRGGMGWGLVTVELQLSRRRWLLLSPPFALRVSSFGGGSSSVGFGPVADLGEDDVLGPWSHSLACLGPRCYPVRAQLGISGPAGFQ